MLADGKDEGVIDCEPRTLWLNDVEIMALSVWSRMPKEEVVRWVFARMNDRQRDGDGVWDVFARMHETLLASIYLQHALPFITRQERLDRVAFLTPNPIRLNESPFADSVSAFKEIPVSILSKGWGFDLGGALHVWRNENANMHNFEAIKPDEASIIVWHL
jgi:hypothetical protein